MSYLHRQDSEFVVDKPRTHQIVSIPVVAFRVIYPNRCRRRPFAEIFVDDEANAGPSMPFGQGDSAAARVSQAPTEEPLEIPAHIGHNRGGHRRSQAVA
jgi:hypothetical protein